MEVGLAPARPSCRNGRRSRRAQRRQLVAPRPDTQPARQCPPPGNCGRRGRSGQADAGHLAFRSASVIFACKRPEQTMARDARTEAEKAFKTATTKPADLPAAKPAI